MSQLSVSELYMHEKVNAGVQTSSDRREPPSKPGWNGTCISDFQLKAFWVSHRPGIAGLPCALEGPVLIRGVIA